MAQLEHHHHEALPNDVLEFLPPDDEGAERFERSGEELAIRSVPDSQLAPLDDPALREDSSEVEALSPASWFEDEEPEPPYRSTEDEDDAAVDDLLVAQHYVFEDEPSDAEASDEDEG
ncbi:MAG: hypothetical protein ABI658_25700 [Acidimicrobiales bacterium]